MTNRTTFFSVLLGLTLATILLYSIKTPKDSGEKREGHEIFKFVVNKVGMKPASSARGRSKYDPEPSSSPAPSKTVTKRPQISEKETARAIELLENDDLCALYALNPNYGVADLVDTFTESKNFQNLESDTQNVIRFIQDPDRYRESLDRMDSPYAQALKAFSEAGALEDDYLAERNTTSPSTQGLDVALSTLARAYDRDPENAFYSVAALTLINQAKPEQIEDYERIWLDRFSKAESYRDDKISMIQDMHRSFAQNASGFSASYAVGTFFPMLFLNRANPSFMKAAKESDEFKKQLKKISDAMAYPKTLLNTGIEYRDFDVIQHIVSDTYARMSGETRITTPFWRHESSVNKRIAKAFENISSTSEHPCDPALMKAIYSQFGAIPEMTPPMSGTPTGKPE